MKKRAKPIEEIDLSTQKESYILVQETHEWKQYTVAENYKNLRLKNCGGCRTKK